jgi:hypothetical protein
MPCEKSSPRAAAPSRWRASCGPKRRPTRLTESCEKSCHAGVNWLLRDLGYDDAKMVEPADRREQLQRDFVAATKSLQTLAAQIERFGS